MFELTFLGTSSGVPTKQRNVAGLAVSFMGEVKQAKGKGNPWILVDCGEATQHQLLKTKLKPRALKMICITHMHGDHCYGLPGLLASLAMHGRTEPLMIVAPAELKQLIELHIQLTQMNLSYPIEFIDVQRLVGDSLMVALAKDWQLCLEVYPLSHRCASYAFAITQKISKDKLRTDDLSELGVPNRLWGKILHSSEAQIELGEYGCYPKSQLVHRCSTTKKIVIAGDNDTPELLRQAVQGASVLVHEATYTESIKQKILAKNTFDPKHSSALEVATFAQSAHVPLLILTHFSARYMLFDNPSDSTPNMGHVRTEAESVFDGRLLLATDFLSVAVE